MRGLARQAAPSTPPCAAGSYGQHRNPSMRGLARQAAPSTSPCADEPSRSKRPGDRGQCRGTTTEHRSSPWAPHQPKLARNSGTRTLCSAPKRCKSKDAISMFEIHVGELRATFLRNHNMRCHKGTTKCPKQKTAQAEDSPSPEDPHNPDSRHKHGGTAPDMGRCTRYGALHPNRRGALPTDRVQRPNTQEQTRNWHTEPLTTTTSPGTGRRAGNNGPVSAGSGPSPRPRWLQYQSASPVRRCGRPQLRRPAPCR